MAKIDPRLVGILVALALIIFVNQNKMEQKEQTVIVETGWQESYRQLVVSEGIGQSYLEETPYYDYSSPLIQRKISQIMSISESPREYVENAAELVFLEIDYNLAANDVQCINGIASKNFVNGEGDCTEQGMALIALLRGAGIPARAVGGCLYLDRTQRCDLFAAVPFKKPRYKELTPEDIEQGTLSRKQGINSRAGGLHLYTEVFLSTEESEGLMVLDETKRTTNGAWIIVEPTTGEIVRKNSCYLYDEELVVPDDRKDLFCSSDNITYAVICSQK